MLSELESNSWLSDKRFSEQFIFSKKNKFGIKKIAFELKSKGVDEMIISHAIDSIRSEEFSLAQGIWKKKFKKSFNTAVFSTLFKLHKSSNK